MISGKLGKGIGEIQKKNQRLRALLKYFANLPAETEEYVSDFRILYKDG